MANITGLHSYIVLSLCHQQTVSNYFHMLLVYCAEFGKLSFLRAYNIELQVGLFTRQDMPRDDVGYHTHSLSHLTKHAPVQTTCPVMPS